MILGVTGETRSLQAQRLSPDRTAIRKLVQLAVARRQAELLYPPRYVSLQGLGLSWSSLDPSRAFKKVVSKIGAQIKRLPKDAYKYSGTKFTAEQIKNLASEAMEHKKQIIAAGLTGALLHKKIVEQGEKWIRDHDKELVGAGAVVAGTVITVASGGTAAPIGMAVAGAGVGATMGKSGQWGKPKEWGTGAAIGGAAGYAAGAVLPAAWGGSVGWAPWGNVASGWGATVPGVVGAAGSGAPILSNPAPGVLATGTASNTAAAAAAAAPTTGAGLSTVSTGLTAATILGGVTKFLGAAQGVLPMIMGSGGGSAGVVPAGAAPDSGYYDYQQPYGISSGYSSGGGGGGGSWGGDGGEEAPGAQAGVLGPITVDTAAARKAMPYIALGLGAAAAVTIAAILLRKKKGINS